MGLGVGGRRNVKQLRGGFVFNADGHLYHSTLGSRVIKKREDWGLVVKVDRGWGLRFRGWLLRESQAACLAHVCVMLQCGLASSQEFRFRVWENLAGPC